MKKENIFLIKNNRGFTLTEIIVVLAILAILIAVAVPSLSGVLLDSRGKVLLQDARAAIVAVEASVESGNKIPAGAAFLELIDKNSPSGNSVSATAYYLGTVDENGMIDRDDDFTLLGITYCDTSKRSGDRAVFIPLNEAAQVYNTFAEADKAAKAYAYVGAASGTMVSAKSLTVAKTAGGAAKG